MSDAGLSQRVKQKAFVVIAAYNERSRLGNVLRDVQCEYPNVVVVDDGSADDTYSIARREPVYALRHAVNRGQGAALQTGIEFALGRGAEFIVTYDADGQHRVEDIAALLAPIAAQECEIALGSRFLGETVHMPLPRRLMLKLAVVFTRIVNRMPLTDAHNGLRAFSRRAAEHIHISMDRMAHASEIIDLVRKSGLPFREVPVQIRYTAYSMAKGQSWRDAARIVLHYFVDRVAR